MERPHARALLELWWGTITVAVCVAELRVSLDVQELEKDLGAVLVEDGDDPVCTGLCIIEC